MNSNFFFFKVQQAGLEMAQKLKALVLPQNQGLTLSTYLVTHNHLNPSPRGIQCPLLASMDTTCTWCTNMYTSIHADTQKISKMK